MIVIADLSAVLTFTAAERTMIGIKLCRVGSLLDQTHHNTNKQGLHPFYTCTKSGFCTVVVPFSSLARSLVECSTIHTPPALFFFFYNLFMEISSRTLIPVFRPESVHSGCSRVFPDKLLVSSFPDRFPHYARTAAHSAHSDFVGSRVYVCLGVTCNLHFWRNDRGLLRATAVTRGWNRHRIRVSTQRYLRKRKFSKSRVMTEQIVNG